jgi:hypothetical protein
MKVTAVLITRDESYPDDILLNYPFDEVLTETKCPGVHRRFELALQARNDVVYVQDDDCVIDIQHLARHYEGRLTYAASDGHQHHYEGTGVALIGWGCFFPKRLVDWTRWNLSQPCICFDDDAKHGYAICPRHAGPGKYSGPSHEADRVFTYLAQPHRAVLMTIRHLKRERAMSRDNPDHYRSRDRIIKELHDLPEILNGGDGE